MANVSISMKKQKQIVGAFQKFPNEMASALGDAIRGAGTYLTGKVKEHITAGTEMFKPPIDTGALRRGIHPVFEKMQARIMPAIYTPYAEFVHQGTGRMQARPFFDITAKREAETVSKFAQARLEKAMKTLVF